MTEELSGRRIVVPEGRELGATRKITRGPKPVRALREIGSDTIIPADEPTTKGLITAMRRLDLSGRYVGVQLNPGTATDGFHRWPCQIQCFPMSTPLKSTMRAGSR